MVSQCKQKKPHVVDTAEEKRIRRQEQARKSYQENVRKRLQSNAMHFPTLPRSNLCCARDRPLEQNSSVNLEYCSTSSDPIGSPAIKIVNENQKQVIVEEQIKQLIENIYVAKEILKDSRIQVSCGKSNCQSLHEIAHTSLPRMVRGSALSSHLRKECTIIRNDLEKRNTSNEDYVGEQMQSVSQQNGGKLFIKDDLLANINRRSTRPDDLPQKMGQTLLMPLVEARPLDSSPLADHNDESSSSFNDNSPMNVLLQLQVDKQKCLAKANRPPFALDPPSEVCSKCNAIVWKEEKVKGKKKLSLTTQPVAKMERLSYLNFVGPRKDFIDY